MSNCQSEDEPSASHMKKGRTGEEAKKQPVIAAAINGEIHPEIFKLDDDCVQETFDWLSIKDIHSVAETCTRMQRVTGDYFQPNLAALQCAFDGESKMTYCGSSVIGFKKFVQKLRIEESANDEDYHFIGQHCKSLKQIYFRSSQLNAIKIEHIKPILSQIENVRFWRCNVDGELYEEYLKFFPSLKRISLHTLNKNVLIGTSNEWLRRTYPTLEHLEIDVSGGVDIPELGTFFDLNPSLRKFSINEVGFVQNVNAMLQTKTKIQVLGVEIYREEETVCRLLKQLHDQGFYERLHLKVHDAEQPTIDRISALLVVEKLYLLLCRDAPKLNLNSLANLKQLDLHAYPDLDAFVIDLESISKNLVNLEQIFFQYFECEMLGPFIQNAANLKAIKIDYLDGVIPNLAALNKKREQLIGAGKITIYINEEALLGTKYLSGVTDFNMIELKRAESYDWEKPLSLY